MMTILLLKYVYAVKKKSVYYFVIFVILFSSLFSSDTFYFFFFFYNTLTRYTFVSSNRILFYSPNTGWRLIPIFPNVYKYKIWKTRRIKSCTVEHGRPAPRLKFFLLFLVLFAKPFSRHCILYTERRKTALLLPRNSEINRDGGGREEKGGFTFQYTRRRIPAIHEDEPYYYSLTETKKLRAFTRRLSSITSTDLYAHEPVQKGVSAAV